MCRQLLEDLAGSDAGQNDFRSPALPADGWPALIVGSDIPNIERSHIVAAFDALRCNDLVFGPSVDGGFWLVGAAQGARVGLIFDDVRWSTDYALSDTLSNVRPGTNVAMLEELADIDDGDAYATWRSGG